MSLITLPSRTNKHKTVPIDHCFHMDGLCMLGILISVWNVQTYLRYHEHWQGWYSNLHSSTNRKHFRAFVYVWNGAFTAGNGNVSLPMWRVTVQSLIQLFFMFWCAFVYVSVFPSSRYCKSDQTCLHSYFLWLQRIIVGSEILKRARRHIKTWQLRQR
jgi:hypothetical protein